MRRKRIAPHFHLAVLLSLLPCTVLAGFAGTDVFLPMVGRLPGVFPSDWYTTVWIHNPGADTVTATVYLLERNVASTNPPSVQVLVPPGDTEKIENAVETLFQRQVFGGMRITAPTRVVVTSRVYSKGVGTGERDSLGQDFAGVPAAFAIGLDESAQILGVHQTVPAGDSDFRFNFGFVETTGHTVTVRVTAFDGNNAEQGWKDFQVREFSQRQFAFKDHFPAVSTENSRLRVQVVSGTGKVIAYGSSIGNGSQDPTTFEMTYDDSLLGISTVLHDATLTGDGTAGAPLGIADGGVAPIKLDTTGAAHGQVLKYGSSVAWQDDGLTLPFSAQVAAQFPPTVAVLEIENTDTTNPGLNSTAIFGRGQIGVGGASRFGSGVSGAAGVGGFPGRRIPSGTEGISSTATGVSGRTFDGVGVWGEHLAATGIAAGVLGETASQDAYAVGALGAVRSTSAGWYSAGVRGINEGTGATGIGVYGSQNGTGYGVFGTTPGGLGVVGRSDTDIGVYGYHDAEDGDAPGILGETDSAAAGAVGVKGQILRSDSGDGSTGVLGLNWGTGKNGVGVWGEHKGNGWGVFGFSDASHAMHGSTNTGVGVYGVAWAAGGRAGEFEGDVNVSGTLTKGGGAFRIDHPLDPENRYLSHSFVESPDMMNIYNGTVVTDAAGEAVVTLPDYFSALNRDFRYQLTVIGEFAQAIVGREVEGNSFVIRTSKPNLKVSWQVTGVRQDRWAEKHRIAVEQDKSEKERGFYLHPDLYDQPPERGVAAALWPDAVGDVKASAVRPGSAQQVKREQQQ
jgi:hypothetical protein